MTGEVTASPCDSPRQGSSRRTISRFAAGIKQAAMKTRRLLGTMMH